MSRKTRILAVNDSYYGLKLWKEVLCLAGYDVTTASDAFQALELAQKETPDLIVSDYLMPLVDGISLCGRIRRIPTLADVPFVIVTVWEFSKDDLLAARAAGVTEVTTEGRMGMVVLDSVARNLRIG